MMPFVRWLLLLFVAGCWRSPDAAPPQLVSEPMLEPTPPAVPPRSVWVGYYSCAQGKTAVQLSIAVSPSGAAKAIFEFGPHEDNPDIPSGKYQMTGTFRELDDGRLELVLQPKRWIDQPSGYTMTGLSARSTGRRRRLEGVIESERCGDIVVERR